MEQLEQEPETIRSADLVIAAWTQKRHIIGYGTPSSAPETLTICREGDITEDGKTPIIFRNAVTGKELSVFAEELQDKKFVAQLVEQRYIPARPKHGHHDHFVVFDIVDKAGELITIGINNSNNSLLRGIVNHDNAQTQFNKGCDFPSTMTKKELSEVEKDLRALEQQYVAQRNKGNTNS